MGFNNLTMLKGTGDVKKIKNVKKNLNAKV